MIIRDQLLVKIMRNSLIKRKCNNNNNNTNNNKIKKKIKNNK